MLSASLEELNERIAKLQKQYDAYVTAYDAIAGAGERLRAEISPRLTEYAARVLSALTVLVMDGFAEEESGKRFRRTVELKD